MNSTDMVRVRQPSSSSTLATQRERVDDLEPGRLSDHIRAVKAPLPSISRRAMSQLQGPSGP